MFKYLVSLIIALSVLMSVPLVQAGTIGGVPGIRSIGGANGIYTSCPDGFYPAFLGKDPEWVGGACTLNVPTGYIPSGRYKMRVEVWGLEGLNCCMDWTETNDLYIDASKSIGDQNLIFSGGSRPFAYPQLFKEGQGAYCVYLKGNGSLYIISGTSGRLYLCEKDSPLPLPPTPPQPVISCSINSGNSLSVNLGTLDRAVIPTVPGSAQTQTAQFPVTCTGGAVSMKMQLNYTPVTVSGTQVINSSVNGVGVAVSYNDKILSPSDVTTMQLAQGTTSVTLKFGAVRNPSVAVGDIKTGPFTASAVLVMTQQ